MAGSQLKRLKAALREQGVIGPQQSKKQKKKVAQDKKASSDKRIQRSEALSNIREQFNPFQFKTSARAPKFDVTTLKPKDEKSVRGVLGRPGAAKAASEEKRRQTLLIEMQRRNKVGGLVDRRLGEKDASLSVEDKMMERFVEERMRTHKKSAVFDLEEDDMMEDGLTHMGQPLTFDVQDDFDETDLPSGDETDSQDERKALKRARLAGLGDAEEGEGQPERKKTKQEVYEEIIAKSKAHKAKRQMTKEEDDDLRLQLDKELPELQALLWKTAKPQPKPEDAPEVLIAGMDKDTLDKDYDLRVKKLIADKRAQPTNKTKTEEELAQEAAEKLKELEQQRIQRMKGMVESDSEDEDEEDAKPRSALDLANQTSAEDHFGLGKGIKMKATATELGFDDEDDFFIEDDLIASGSELDLDLDELDEDSEGEKGASDGEPEAEADGEDDEFTKGLLTEAESKDASFQDLACANKKDSDGIPYAFPCPQTHEEFLAILENVETCKQPVVVQRIRALYHPGLDSKNKERLGAFSRVVVQHIFFLAKTSENFTVLESLIRHVHSLAKTFPVEVSTQYRETLVQAEKSRPLSLEVPDLAILTAIGTTFPTSDHFHQVVTPAILCISRYLGQRVPKTLADYAVGTYLCILAVQYQQLAKRFVPEVINFALNTCALAPAKPGERYGLYPHHEPSPGLRVKNARDVSVRKLSWKDCQDQVLSSEAANEVKMAILDTTVSVLKAAAELWSSHAAFIETFQPVLRALQHLSSSACRKQLPEALLSRVRDATAFIARLSQLARLSRRPLELHHHKPLAIRTVAPRFDEDGFTGRIKDPDRERAELAKLKAEYRKERKGATRELRRDAAFVARENLRQKRARDEAYEAKYKRLVAEIQGEEGRAANEYEREKKARQRKR